jgi:hypothetical protein
MTPAVEGTFSWADDRTMVFTPSSKMPVATDFSVYLEGGYEDLAGNDATDPSQPLRFRTVDLPRVTASEPADGADGVALDSTVSLTFDRLMDTAVTVRALTLQPAAAIRTTWRGSTLIVSPETAFAAGTTYRLTVSTTAADTDGNPLAEAHEIGFSTVDTGLGISRALPSDGSAGVPVDGDIALVFDEPIDPSTVGDSLQVTPTVSGSVRVTNLPSDAGAAGANAGDTVLVFDPSQRLAPHTTYTVALRAGVVRAAGADQVAEGRSWSFTTGSPPDILQNQVVFLSARSGVRNVWAMNPDGTNAHQLTAEMAPVTSYDLTADGRSLVYATAGSIRRLTLPEGVASTLSEEGDAEYAPRLLPDGSAVVVWRRDRQTAVDRGLWLLPIDGNSAARQLLASGAPALGSTASAAEVPDLAAAQYPWAPRFAISGDGRTLLGVNGDRRVVRVNLVGSSLTAPGSTLELIEAAGPPIWSGSQGGFVVVARRASESTPGAWLVRPQGAPERLVDLGGWPDMLDGALVGLDADGGDRIEYRRSPRISGTRLTNAPGLLDRQPSFAPGGASVVFVRVPEGAPDRSGGVWSVGIDGQGLRQLSPDGSDPRWLP